MKRSMGIKKEYKYLSSVSYSVFVEPTGSYIGVRSGALFFSDLKMTVASGSSDTNADAIMKVLQSISSQNRGIELKIEQQNYKADVQVHEISELFENLGARVSNQGAQMECQLKLHGDKLAAKINVFEEEFSNTVASLNAKHGSLKKLSKRGSRKCKKC